MSIVVLFASRIIPSINKLSNSLTGLSNIEVLDAAERTAAGKDLAPTISIVDGKGNEVLLPNCLRAKRHHPLGKFVLWRTQELDEVVDLQHVS